MEHARRMAAFEKTPLSPAMLAAIVPQLIIPWTTMGGIKGSNIDQVVALGARHPAVMTAVTAAPYVVAAARDLRQKITGLQ
jgi:thiamine monophosphate synthase